MIRSSSVLRHVTSAVATAVLALTVGLSAAVPARADDGGVTPGLCILNCPSGSAQPDEPGKRKPSVPPPDTPSPPPSAPAPAPTFPAIPAAPAPAPVPAVAPEPTVPALEETPTPDAATTTAEPSATTASPSTESNWDKPVTRSAKHTQAAAVSRNDDSGLFGSPGLLAIVAGVLLVGISGLAFAWWGRNRLASH
ncbi:MULTISPECIES: hypothetical protein [unclassified Arthrobacter]|uniref:hypothetical protein n=1 Tax=unclassified Arthrobacter TaxID=235627 RepID=UPI0033964E3F